MLPGHTITIQHEPLFVQQCPWMIPHHQNAVNMAKGQWLIGQPFDTATPPGRNHQSEKMHFCTCASGRCSFTTTSQGCGVRTRPGARLTALQRSNTARPLSLRQSGWATRKGWIIHSWCMLKKVKECGCHVSCRFR